MHPLTMNVETPQDMLRALRWPTQYAAQRLGVSTTAIILFRNKDISLNGEVLVTLRRSFDSWRSRRPVASFV